MVMDILCVCVCGGGGGGGFDRIVGFFSILKYLAIML